MSCCAIQKDNRRISHCKICNSCPETFTLKVNPYWNDVDIICKCGNAAGYIYCFHCVKSRLRNIPSMVIEWANDRTIMTH